MEKIKVHEIAKQLNISNNEVIEGLSKIEVIVKSHLSSITKEEYDKFLKSRNKGNVVEKAKEKEKNKEKKEVKETKKEAKKESEQLHIIRRNVKVINTSEDKEEIQEITTKINGDIQKNKQVISNQNEKKHENYSNRYNNSNNRSGFAKNNFGRRNINVVVTRNGKVVEKEPVKEEVKVKEVVKKEEIKPQIENVKNQAINEEPITKISEKEKNEVKGNVELEENVIIVAKSDKENQDKKQNVTQNADKKQYNNSGSEKRKYNNQDSDRRQHNNQDSDRRQYNNQNSDRRQYNNYNNQNGDRRQYNNYNNSNGDRRQNNNYNGQNSDRRQYNNYNNTNGDRRQYNNYSNASGDRRQQGGQNKFGRPQMSQVDRFVKAQADIASETKETRDYSATLIDKKKYNNSNSSSDGKKEKLNKNELRERHTRVSTSKLRGLEVDSSGSMLDLYERDSDSVKKYGKKKKEKKAESTPVKIVPLTEVKLPETMTVKELAEIIKKQAAEVIKKLFALGIMATQNQEIDFDTAYLVAGEFGINAEKQVIVTEEDILFDDSEDKDEDMIPRPPIVCVMGHVDHGKTSLLDRIRKTNVISGEAGGITQHIGAYKVEINSKEICFLDTPGHEAFTAMRARGAQITDIAIIVVAADDGIKPQTIEAINHAKAAEVSIIVAINKIDKPGANPDKVKQELLEVGLVPEEWGGDTICVPISAMTGEGVENLLEMILLTAEMKDLRANPNKQSKGTVIEARLDKNIGTVASLLVQRGQLNVGDTIVVGDMIGKIRAMKDDKGRKVKAAGPSTPVEVIGLGEVPQTGDVFYEVENEKVAKQLVEKRKANIRKNLIKQTSKVTLDELFGQIKEGEIKNLNIVLKTDVQGTLEALKDSLEKIKNDEVQVKVIHAATGAIKESDVTLASVSNAIIIGFNVRPESVAASQAEKEKVDMRLYRVIYDAINDVEDAMKGMLKPTYKEVIHGQAEVRALFKISSIGTIAGCYVKSGKMVRNAMIRLLRDNVVLTDVKLDSLKREKDDAKEVKEGFECGIKLENFNDIQEGDIFECYEMVEEKRK